MRSAKLARAMSKGLVFVRNTRTGQLLLKFRHPDAADRIIPPYGVEDENRRRETFLNLTQFYTAEQLKNSNLEDFILQGDLELTERP